MLSKWYFQFLTSIKNHMLLKIRHLLPGDIDVKSFSFTYLVQHIEGYLGINDIAIGSCDDQGAFADAFGGVCNEQFGVEGIFHTESFANRTSSFRRIEGEECAGGGRGLAALV